MNVSASNRGTHMMLTTEQLQAIDRGEPVRIVIDGKPCVLLSQDAFEELEDDMEYGPMTEEEMDILASETADMLEGDGLDEPL